MSARRIVQIAGYHEGEQFDPEVLSKMATRLRRSGVFQSVSITEAKTVSPGNRLDFDLTLVEEPPRRFGFGAEASSSDGANLSAFWLHRNLFGGGERFRLDGLVQSIGANTGMAEYQFGARIDLPHHLPTVRPLLPPLSNSPRYLASRSKAPRLDLA